MFSAFKSKFSRIFPRLWRDRYGSSQTSRTERDTPILCNATHCEDSVPGILKEFHGVARLNRIDLIYRPFPCRFTKNVNLNTGTGGWIFHHRGEISRLAVQVIAVLIIQSFLIFDLAFAANGKISNLSENSYLSPALQINGSGFRRLVDDVIKKEKVPLRREKSAIPLKIKELEKMSKEELKGLVSMAKEGVDKQVSVLKEKRDKNPKDSRVIQELRELFMLKFPLDGFLLKLTVKYDGPFLDKDSFVNGWWEISRVKANYYMIIF